MPLPFEGDPALLGQLLVGVSEVDQEPSTRLPPPAELPADSSEQTEMPPPGPLMQSASVETSPRSSLDIAE